MLTAACGATPDGFQLFGADGAEFRVGGGCWYCLFCWFGVCGVFGLPPGGVTDENALGPPIGLDGVGGVAGIDIGVTGVNGVGVDALLFT